MYEGIFCCWQAFVELQHKMIETSQKLRLADIQIEQLKSVITHSQLTEKEIKVWFFFQDPSSDLLLTSPGLSTGVVKVRSG